MQLMVGDFKKVLNILIVIALFLAIALVVLNARQFSRIDGSSLSVGYLVQGFDLLYEIIVLPFGNFMHALLAFILALVVFATSSKDL